MIVATNSSFNAANNKQLKKLVAMLKPGAIIPDRRNIGGNLLDEIYEEEQAKVRKQLEHWLHLWPPQLAWRDSSQRLA